MALVTCHRHRLILMMFMCLPLMTVLLIGKSSNDCLKSLPVKVNLINFNSFLCLLFKYIEYACVNEFVVELNTVTAVDSGRRALQLLGLDEEKSSVGFHVSVEIC